MWMLDPGLLSGVVLLNDWFLLDEKNMVSRAFVDFEIDNLVDLVKIDLSRRHPDVPAVIAEQFLEINPILIVGSINRVFFQDVQFSVIGDRKKDWPWMLRSFAIDQV